MFLPKREFLAKCRVFFKDGTIEVYHDIFIQLDGFVYVSEKTFSGKWRTIAINKDMIEKIVGV